jgi:malate synthase
MRLDKTFNDLKEILLPEDIDQLLDILGHRLRAKNYELLKRRLEKHSSLVPTYGILERLVKDKYGHWSYTAGQSYPDEIRVVRNIILNLR